MLSSIVQNCPLHLKCARMLFCNVARNKTASKEVLFNVAVSAVLCVRTSGVVENFNTRCRWLIKNQARLVAWLNYTLPRATCHFQLCRFPVWTSAWRYRRCYPTVRTVKNTAVFDSTVLQPVQVNKLKAMCYGDANKKAPASPGFSHKEIFINIQNSTLYRCTVLMS